MYSKINEDFNKVIECSQGFYPNQNVVDEIFEKWQSNKRWFIEKVGGMIYEVPEVVSFELDKSSKRQKVENFSDGLYRMSLYDLAEFVNRQSEGFYSNQVVEDYRYGDTIIQKGSKLLKAFKHFIQNKDVLKEIQDKASMVIQEDKIKGKLCFSVHPLDYLSLSENNHNWRSCHALDGEYRAGNLSYMCDESTIICYLKSEEDTILPNFPNSVPWNNKKWRVLLFFARVRDVIFFGRQYPMFSEDALQTVQYFLYKMGICNGSWCFPSKDNVWRVGDHTLNGKYYPIMGKLQLDRDVICDQSDELHFNDLLRSSCYSPYYTYQHHWVGENYVPKIMIGSRVNCLHCGQDVISPGENGSMLCADCDDQDDNYCYCDY